ncbi:mannose-1-phosphate guanylyltransferase/mannose-6-phosphate isomerase [Alphaproteobacteria bacterium]|nr:mannose-1-phosphate guanylyltransferase/mannose-6-phosphate isomerase [Alphaproteobacteria bacterium]
MAGIVPIILAGGIGTRLWPVSRQSFPKQFVPLIGSSSLFQQSVLRVKGDEFFRPLIVTSDKYRFLVSDQLNTADVGADIVIEPEGKNTAPAILAAAIISQKSAIDASLLVMPSDHFIPDALAFTKTISSGMPTSNNGAVVTFGVKPSRVETGYGYIEALPGQGETCRPIKGFYEKPDYLRAKEMFDSGSYLWNTGIFLFKAKTILELAEMFQPKMLSDVRKAVANGYNDLDYFRISPAEWALVEANSIDYAIMEKAKNIFCVDFQPAWSDLGDWRAIANLLEHDANNNVISQSSTGIECTNTMLWSTAERVRLTGLGLDNIVAVATDDAILVASADRLQEVRKIVTALESEGAPEATEHSRDYRPWGWFESLVLMPGYQVKRLHVYPRSKLSLQSHKYRSEHWVVVSGSATVCRENEVFTLESNESVYIKAGQKHRLANETDDPLTVIEVQTGSYLAEDDIIRFEDAYHRAVQ